MPKRDIADRLCGLVYKRFKEEQPERELTKDEMDGIWHTIYGKLCRGETESDVAEWCKVIELDKKTIHAPMRNGYTGRG